MLEEFLTLWPVILFLGASIIWFVRLESKVLYLEKDHQSQKEIQEKKDTILWAKFDAIQTSTNEVREILARVEERLKQNNRG